MHRFWGACDYKKQLDWVRLIGCFLLPFQESSLPTSPNIINTTSRIDNWTHTHTPNKKKKKEVCLSA